MRDIIKRVATGTTTVEDARELEKVFEVNEALRAEVAEWKARADDLAAALNKCIDMAYKRNQDELPSAIIKTATKAVNRYHMLVDFSATLGD